MDYLIHEDLLKAVMSTLGSIEAKNVAHCSNVQNIMNALSKLEKHETEEKKEA